MNAVGYWVILGPIIMAVAMFVMGFGPLIGRLLGPWGPARAERMRGPAVGGILEEDNEAQRMSESESEPASREDVWERS
ncbi:hypothetical protein [Rhizohabitans arisaemae]|uniref:hypothetical protein n=1 Tax=Rhizohabitans arisaemae TaxID=2720610 RepID=UPI0024B0F225|nr:hypothetical protein [Rhizohabitans arisaemae]